MTKLRLADLDREAEVVELPDGTETPVKRLDGVMAHMWREFVGTPEDERDPCVLWELAGRCLPGVDQEIVDSLTAAQAGAVIAVASGNVESVLEALKNVTGAEEEDATPKSSSPKTQSAQSSVSSPEQPDDPPESSP